MKAGKHSLPIVLRMSGRPVVLVGEGPAADAHRRILERAGAHVVGEGSRAALAIVIDDAAAVSRMKVRGCLVYAVGHPEQSDFTLGDTFEAEFEPDHQPVPDPALMRDPVPVPAPLPAPVVSAPIAVSAMAEPSWRAEPATPPRVHALVNALKRSLPRLAFSARKTPLEIDQPETESRSGAEGFLAHAGVPGGLGDLPPAATPEPGPRLAPEPEPRLAPEREPERKPEPIRPEPMTGPEPLSVPLPESMAASSGPGSPLVMLEPTSGRAGPALGSGLQTFADAFARSIQSIPRPASRAPRDRISLEIALAKGGPLEADDHTPGGGETEASPTRRADQESRPDVQEPQT